MELTEHFVKSIGELLYVLKQNPVPEYNELIKLIIFLLKNDVIELIMICEKNTIHILIVS